MLTQSEFKIIGKDTRTVGMPWAGIWISSYIATTSGFAVCLGIAEAVAPINLYG